MQGMLLGAADDSNSAVQRSADERFEARQEAARGAVNIDPEERRRRIIFGGALLVRALLTYSYMTNQEHCAHDISRTLRKKAVPNVKSRS